MVGGGVLAGDVVHRVEVLFHFVCAKTDDGAVEGADGSQRGSGVGGRVLLVLVVEVLGKLADEGRGWKTCEPQGGWRRRRVRSPSLSFRRLLLFSPRLACTPAGSCRGPCSPQGYTDAEERGATGNVRAGRGHSPPLGVALCPCSGAAAARCPRLLPGRAQNNWLAHGG